MKSKTIPFLPTIGIGLFVFLCIVPASPQSQAVNGQIEGTVSDQNNAAVPNAVMTVTNIETGATRTVTSAENGVYRFPLLPLGIYRITAEAANFKKLVREGITLTTGQTATVNLEMPAGEIQEIVTVSLDTSIADAGKTDLGRVINNRDVQSLPIPQRNPYNLGLLEANVTGRTSRVFEPPILHVNGYLRRVNYLLDGNWSTQADRPGVRLLFVSETYINEVQLVTNGFAPEFGNTPGMIFNVVTSSGTNKLKGSVGFRFALTPFYARPFFYDSADDLPSNNVTDLTGSLGGAFIKDRWHFYGGFEAIRRDDKVAGGRLVTIRPEHKALLISAGLPSSIFPATIPTSIQRDFYIFRTDVQLDKNNRLSARLNRSPHIAHNFSNGGLNTLERSIDILSPDYSFGAQLVSYGVRGTLNELRFQFAERAQRNQRSAFSGSGPSISITEVAAFGSPTNANALTVEDATHIQNNLTWNRGPHVLKIGGGFIFIHDLRRSEIFSRYTFPSIPAYLSARNGSPQSYSSYEETFGNPEITYKATYWNVFVQDDWKVRRRLKINYGLRYDLYLIPKADPGAPFAASQKFNVDGNNIAPRFGVVYALREGDRPTIIRAGAGVYFETPWLDIYERALLRNGNARFYQFRFLPGDSGAPAFPNTFSGSNPVLTGQNLDTIAPDFENMYAVHSNIQVEQVLTENLSLALGYVYSAGRHLPVYRSINQITPTRFLGDGRPVFGPARLDPRFNVIQMVESAGVFRYDALTLQLTKRFSSGIQFKANYTLAKATDDAPDLLHEGLLLSDPSDRALDKGYSSTDQRHTFSMSVVASPQFSFQNKRLRDLFNKNQFGIIATANSGATFNIISGLDLNRDGVVTSDRPVGIRRNAGRTPAQYNVDLKYSRFLNLTKDWRLEVFGEFQNLFNVNSIVQFNNVRVATDAFTGELIGGLPDFRARNQSSAQESRQLQLGVKLIF